MSTWSGSMPNLILLDVNTRNGVNTTKSSLGFLGSGDIAHSLRSARLSSLYFMLGLTQCYSRQIAFAVSFSVLRLAPLRANPNARSPRAGRGGLAISQLP